MTDPEPTPLALPDRPDPDDIIASTWGQWIHDQIAGDAGFTQFDHAGLNTAVPAAHILGTTPLGPYTWPVIVTVAATYNFGFGNNPGNFQFHLRRLVDNVDRSTPGPFQSTTAGCWYQAHMSSSWEVPAGQPAGFATVGQLLAGGTAGIYMTAIGLYHVRRKPQT